MDVVPEDGDFSAKRMTATPTIAVTKTISGAK